jgi:hypothetical protein
LKKNKRSGKGSHSHFGWNETVCLDRYGIEVKNFFVKPACVDLEKFSASEKDNILLKELGFENKVVCVVCREAWRYLFKEEVFNFIKLCYDHWKDDFRFLMLTNATKEEINTEIQRVNLPKIALSAGLYIIMMCHGISHWRFCH